MCVCVIGLHLCHNAVTFSHRHISFSLLILFSVIVLTASMLIFNKSMVQIAGMQVLNQAFNSTVTAINSTKKSEGSKLLKSFAAATAGATAVGMILKFGLKGPAVEKMQAFIPFAAVAAGQAVNVPLMRMEELEEGVPVMETKGGDKGKKTCSGKKKAKADVRGYSKAAARKALVEVWATRVFMAIPPMVSVPIIMDAITTKTSLLSANPSLAVPLTSVLVGLNLCLSTPLALSAFPQEGSIAVKKLEASIASKVKDSSRALTYDKGL